MVRVPPPIKKQRPRQGSSHLASYLPPFKLPRWADAPCISISELSQWYSHIDPIKLTDSQLLSLVKQYAVEFLQRRDLAFPSVKVDIVCKSYPLKRWSDLRFVCPSTRAVVTALYIVDHRLVSREAFTQESVRAEFEARHVRWRAICLLKNSRGRLPEDVLELLDAEIERVGAGDDMGLLAALEGARIRAAERAAQSRLQKARAKRRRLREARRREAADARIERLAADTMGIWAALRRAEASPATARAAVKGLSLAPGPDVEIVHVTHPLAASAAVLEDHLRIDLRVLQREERYWRPGQRTEFALTEGFLIGLELSEGVKPHILFGFRVDGRACLQGVQIILDPINGRVRPRFNCTAGGLCEVLAFRSGRFAPARSLMLLHRTQLPYAPVQTPF